MIMNGCFLPIILLVHIAQCVHGVLDGTKIRCLVVVCRTIHIQMTIYFFFCVEHKQTNATNDLIYHNITEWWLHTTSKCYSIRIYLSIPYNTWTIFIRQVNGIFSMTPIKYLYLKWEYHSSSCTTNNRYTLKQINDGKKSLLSRKINFKDCHSCHRINIEQNVVLN